MFGPVEAISYSIEFQKRGLPHMHMLVTLREDYRPITSANVDALTQATLVLEDDDPVLHDLVKKHMIHGPCGEHNPTAPCMRDRRCEKRFPKQFRARTEFKDDGSAIYARPNDGQGYWYVRFYSQTVHFSLKPFL